MNTEASLYNIEYFSGTDPLSSSAFEKLSRNELDGFVIPGFLNADEVASIVKGFRALADSELVHIEKDFDSYPMSFAQFDQMVQRGLMSEQDYFELSRRFVSSFANRFGVDVLAKMQALFGSMPGAPQLDLAPNATTSGHYVPFTFRELFAGVGCLKAHCENLFLREFPGFFNRINTFSKPDKQLSFFIVLQGPGAGGELTLFDILWNEQQQRIGDHEIKLEDEMHYAFNDSAALRRDHITPLPGSLVVFSGGTIWHRVETITAAPSRITLGGFLSFAHDNSKLYSWS